MSRRMTNPVPSGRTAAARQKPLSPSSPRWHGPIDGRTGLLAILLIGATLIVYLQVCQFGYILLDDPRYVPGNTQVRNGISLDGIRWAFTTFCDGNWIPLTWLSLMLDTTIYGGRPGGYHVTNL